MSEVLLTSAACAFVGLLAQMMTHAAAAKGATNCEGYVQDSLFVIAGGFVSDLLLTSAGHACVGINMKMMWHAAAALEAAPGDLHVPEILFAIVGNCHVFAFCWTGHLVLLVLLLPEFAILELLLNDLFQVRVRNKAVHSAKKKVMILSCRLPLRL